MMKLMGFASFDSTKGKKVDGSVNAYAINVSQKRKYRYARPRPHVLMLGKESYYRIIVLAMFSTVCTCVFATSLAYPPHLIF